MNKIYFAVDKDGTEWAFSEKPERTSDDEWYNIESELISDINPPLSIELITGVKMGWENEPLEWIPFITPGPDEKLIAENAKLKDYNFRLLDRLDEMNGFEDENNVLKGRIKELEAKLTKMEENIIISGIEDIKKRLDELYWKVVVHG